MRQNRRIGLGVLDKNFWFTTAMVPIAKNLQLPTPPPEAPGLFRCAAPGMIAQLFARAGLKNGSEMNVKTTLRIPSAEVFWNFMSEHVEPIISALSKVDDTVRSEIKKEVCGTIGRSYLNGNIAIGGDAILIFGEK